MIESDLIKARMRQGLAVARVVGKLRGPKPKLSPTREALLVDLHRTGQKRSSDLAELSALAGPPSTARSSPRPQIRLPSGAGGTGPVK